MLVAHHCSFTVASVALSALWCRSALWFDSPDTSLYSRIESTSSTPTSYCDWGQFCTVWTPASRTDIRASPSRQPTLDSANEDPMIVCRICTAKYRLVCIRDDRECYCRKLVHPYAPHNLRTRTYTSGYCTRRQIMTKMQVREKCKTHQSHTLELDLLRRTTTPLPQHQLLWFFHRSLAFSISLTGEKIEGVL
jgi:hypothetical protein